MSEQNAQAPIPTLNAQASQMTFEDAFASQVQQMPDGFRKRRFQHLLDLPADSSRRKGMLLRMEGDARKQLGASDDAEINWAHGASYTATSGTVKTIDWNSLLQFFITNILPLLLKLLGI